MSACDQGTIIFWTLCGEFIHQAPRTHTAAVKWAHISRAEDRSVTVSCEKRVAVWDLAARQLLHTFTSSVGSRVLSFASSRDCTVGAIAFFDGTVEVWALDPPKCFGALQVGGVQIGGWVLQRVVVCEGVVPGRMMGGLGCEVVVSGWFGDWIGWCWWLAIGWRVRVDGRLKVARVAGALWTFVRRLDSRTRLGNSCYIA